MIPYWSIANSKTSHWLIIESQVLATVKGLSGLHGSHGPSLSIQCRHTEYPIYIPVLSFPVGQPFPLSFPLARWVRGGALLLIFSSPYLCLRVAAQGLGISGYHGNGDETL